HLDRYRDLQAYYADKQRLFSASTPETAWILNADDDAVLELAAGAAGERRYGFSLRREVELGAWCGEDGMMRGRLAAGEVEDWLPVDEFPLLGMHNVANALAAALAARLAGCSPSAVGDGLRKGRGLPHRLEPVGEFDGVLWVNDSKATNVAAATAAVRAFDRPIVLMLGGRHKGEPYTTLARAADDRLRAVVAFGEAAPRIVAELEDAAPEIIVENGMDAAVRAAGRQVRSGDVVLFSPACSSFDMYPNFEVRGEAFVRATRALRETEAS
ncbi:MAG: UDP-N-acetylmuramoyl-L-alanine--D-glutamate ligase, partial [Gemmatimonadota bacterium]